jgi:dihydroneopterin aldolase
MDNDHILAARFVARESLDDDRLLDRLFVSDLVLPCNIGVYDHEKEAPQRVRFNVDLRVRRPSGAIGDDLANVLSYDDVIHGIRDLIAERHFNLVETLAEEIASQCLDDRRVARVQVKIEKLDVHPEAEAVGVEIERRQEAREPVNVYRLPTRR